MRSASQIQDSITEARDELDAIVAISEREERDLNAEESARVTDLAEKVIPDLQAKFKTALKIENERNSRAATRLDAEIAAQRTEREAGNPGAETNHRFGAIKIPAKAKVHAPLKAYKGEDAQRDAYIAGNVILAGIFGNQAAAQFCRNHGLQVNASLTTGTNSTGGFLVPEEMSQALIRLREERGVFPQFANRVPMGSDTIRVPRLLSDVTAYWTGEGVEATASDPALGSAELVSKKLMALTKISSELDEDSIIEVGDMITQSMAYAMADKIDEAAFNGDGTSTYGGVLGIKNALDSAAIKVAATGHDAPNNLTLTDWEGVLAMYPQYPGASPRWFMHSAVYYSSCVALMNAAGGNTNVTLANGVMTPMFLGFPVTFVQVMHSTVTTSASTQVAYFGDLRLGASYGTRRSARTMVSAERYFELDLIGIKSTERVAINIHERGADIRTRPILALKTAA